MGFIYAAWPQKGWCFLAKKAVSKRTKSRAVVVRSSASGVWLGWISEQNAATRSVRLTQARRAWNWTGAASCSGMALTGPTGGKICEPVSAVTIYDVCEVIDATDAAVLAWKAVAAWTAR